MSVDTNITNKQLGSYHRVRHPQFKILVSPVLSGLASRMRITTRGRFVKNLVVEFADDTNSESTEACC